MVPNKPSRVGIWIYELSGLLSNDRPFMLDIKVFSIEAQRGETEHVSSIIERWMEVVKEYTEIDQESLLCMFR